LGFFALAQGVIENDDVGPVLIFFPVFGFGDEPVGDIALFLIGDEIADLMALFGDLPGDIAEISLIKPVKDTNRKFFLSIRPHGRRIGKAIIHAGNGNAYAARRVATQLTECREMRGAISPVVTNGRGDATEG
jgi:hypothetical protein